MKVKIKIKKSEKSKSQMTSDESSFLVDFLVFLISSIM
jgi:hypothetical protein